VVVVGVVDDADQFVVVKSARVVSDDDCIGLRC
jgi:hypothetical protein